MKKRAVEERPAPKIRPPRLPPVDKAAYEAVDKIRADYNLSWDDFFQRLHLYANGLHYMFQAPAEFTKQLQLDLNTAMGLIDMWCANIEANFCECKRCGDIQQIRPRFEGRTALIVGAGPSLHRRGHLDALKRAKEGGWDGDVITTAHALIWCLEAGVIPEIVCIVDGAPVIAQFLDDPRVDQYADDINFCACTSIHPDTLNRWPGSKKYFFRTSVPWNILPNVDTLLAKVQPNYTEIDSGGNNGTACLSLAVALGMQRVGAIGFDLGYPKGFPYQETQYWEAYAQSIPEHYKDEADLIEKVYHDYLHTVFGTWSYYDFVYEVFRNSLFELTTVYRKHGIVDFINCTEGGTVEHESIRCMSLEKFLAGG